MKADYEVIPVEFLVAALFLIAFACVGGIAVHNSEENFAAKCLKAGGKTYYMRGNGYTCMHREAVIELN